MSLEDEKLKEDVQDLVSALLHCVEAEVELKATTSAILAKVSAAFEDDDIPSKLRTMAMHLVLVYLTIYKKFPATNFAEVSNKIMKLCHDEAKRIKRETPKTHTDSGEPIH